MPDEKLHVIPHPESGLARVGSQGGRIPTEMVSGALALARVAKTDVALVPRFRISEHLFCEPDYQQILLWARALALGPEMVIERLLAIPRYWEQKNITQFENGRIIKLGWYLRLLPLIAFDWVPGLVVEAIAFVGTDHAERVLSLPLPQLRHLDCGSMGLVGLDLTETPLLTWLSCDENQLTELDLSTVQLLTELDINDNQITTLDLTTVPQLTSLFWSQNQIAQLDLSAVPKLTRLYCAFNQLTELNLSAVPYLTELLCHNNELTELDIRPLKHLEMLTYDSDRTRLIQRPDQNF